MNFMKLICFLLIILFSCHTPVRENRAPIKSDIPERMQFIQMSGRWNMMDTQSFFTAFIFQNSSLLIDTRGDTILHYRYRMNVRSISLYELDTILISNETVLDKTDSSFTLSSLLAEHYPHHLQRSK